MDLTKSAGPPRAFLLPHIVIARSTCDEAIHLLAAAKEWIASRSLSPGARSRDPLARNDGGSKRISRLDT